MDEKQIVVRASDGRALIFSTAQLAVKTTRSAQGVAVMSLKRKAVVDQLARELEAEDDAAAADAPKGGDE